MSSGKDCGEKGCYTLLGSLGMDTGEDPSGVCHNFGANTFSRAILKDKDRAAGV
jgi:hypothetical protein